MRDEIESALYSLQTLVKTIHAMFKTNEIGAQTGYVGTQYYKLIPDRSHASDEVVKPFHDDVELGIDLPKHPVCKVFRLGHPQYTRALGSM